MNMVCFKVRGTIWDRENDGERKDTKFCQTFVCRDQREVLELLGKWLKRTFPGAPHDREQFELFSVTRTNSPIVLD